MIIRQKIAADKIRLSPSAMNTYNTCELAYLFSYDTRKAAAGMTDPVVYAAGRAFHRWAENYVKYLERADSPYDQEKALEIASEDVPHNLEPDEYELIKRVFMRWSLKEVIEDPVNTKTELRLAVDADMNLVGWDDPEVIARMILDRSEISSDGELIVIDYKTARAIKPINDAAGMLYSFGAAKYYDYEAPVKYIEEYVRLGRINEKTYQPEEYGKVVDRYRKLWAHLLDKEEWEARISGSCTTCSHRLACPAYQEELAGTDLAIDDDEGAVALASKIFLQQQRINDAKKVLQARYGISGAIVFGDQQYTQSISVKPVLKPLYDALLAIVDRLDCGIADVANVCSLNKASIKRLVKKYDRSGRDRDEVVYDLVTSIGSWKSEGKFIFKKADEKGEPS